MKVRMQTFYGGEHEMANKEEKQQAAAAAIHKNGLKYKVAFKRATSKSVWEQ